MLHGEYSPWHAVKAVVLTGVLFHLCLFAGNAARANEKFVLRATTSALLGLLVSLVVGLVDYYGVINLRSLRGLDPVVNPGDVQFRLQSFFGHSGWFAEYVTLCIPTVIILLALKIARPLKIALIIFILLIGEFVLILTFQRGGWISYPVTLLVTWTAIYLIGNPTRVVVDGEDNSSRSFAQLLRSVAPKILISLPLTVVISLGLIMTLKHFNALPQFEGVSVDAYVSRFEDITKSSDRTQFMQAGAMLGATSPIIGLGAESFAYWFRELFKLPGGMYHGTFDLPLFGSAHNVYAQTFSGKGILGVVTLLCLMISLLLRGASTIRTTAHHRPQELLSAGILFAICCSFLIYGVVQEIFYISSLEVILFLLLMILVARIDVAFPPLRRNLVKLIFLAALIIHFSFVTVPTVSEAQDDTIGCHAIEVDKSRWCGPRSSVRVSEPTTPPTKIFFGNVFRKNLPASLIIRKNDTEKFEVPFTPGESVPLPLTVAKGDRLSFQTKAYFIPSLRGITNDRRILSFKLIY